MSRRSVGSRRASPWQKESTWPVPTGRPAARNSRPNPASAGSTCVTPPSASVIGEDAPEVVADPYEVVVILDDGPERHVDRVAFETRCTQEREGLGPLDGLGDAGRLHEIERADSIDGFRHAPGEVGGNGGRAGREDLDLAAERRVVDPVVEAP